MPDVVFEFWKVNYLFQSGSSGSNFDLALVESHKLAVDFVIAMQISIINQGLYHDFTTASTCEIVTQKHKNIVLTRNLKCK